MTTTLAQLDIEQAAKEAAGNWRSFDCFSWDRAAELNDADDWTIVYTHHRDSGLVDQSNAEAIRKVLQPLWIGNRATCWKNTPSWAVAWIGVPRFECFAVVELQSVSSVARVVDEARRLSFA